MFQVGEKVSKVNVKGQIGSERVYEIATATPIADMDEFYQRRHQDVTVVYTVRKVGGKGKGGCYYTDLQLVAAK